MKTKIILTLLAAAAALSLYAVDITISTNYSQVLLTCDIYGNFYANGIRLPTPSTNQLSLVQYQTISASTNSTLGLPVGTIRWDTNYIYVVTGPNIWHRAALSAW